MVVVPVVVGVVVKHKVKREALSYLVSLSRKLIM